MWTEDDLRAELLALGRAAEERETELTDRVLAGARGRRVGRSLRFTAVAAAVVLALAIPGAIGGVRLLRPDRPAVSAAAPADAARAPFSVTFTAPSVAGYTVLTVEAEEHRQQVTLVAPDRPDRVARLSIEDPGGPEPALSGDATRVTVAGRPGFLVPDAPDPVDPRSFTPLLQWQYRDGAWAVLRLDLGSRPDDGTARDLLAIAGGLRLGPPTPLTFPLRLHQVPPGLRASAVRVSYGVVGPALDATELTCVDPVTGDEFAIRATQGSAFAPDQKPGASGVRPDRTVAGHPAWYSADILVVDLGTFSISVYSPNAAERYPEAVLDKILIGMTFATWADRSSWFDVSTVLPG